MKIQWLYLRLDVLYDKTCTVTPMAIDIKKARNAQCSATNIAQYSKVSHRVVMAIIFIWRGIVLCSRKFFIYGPSLGWFISQSYSPLLLRRKRAADRSSRGVVGSTGKNIPRIANPRDISPNIVRNIFTGNF